MDSSKFVSKYQNETTAATLWSDELVQSCMEETLTKIFELHERMQSSHEITTNELEWILSDLPIQLIHVSERLGKLQLALETIKFTLAREEIQYTQELTVQSAKKYTATELKRLVTEHFIDDNIGITVYESAIHQVDKYISLSKELIMGAKKIWQRRMDTESANPITPPKDLPDYTNASHL